MSELNPTTPEYEAFVIEAYGLRQTIDSKIEEGYITQEEGDACFQEFKEVMGYGEV